MRCQAFSTQLLSPLATGEDDESFRPGIGNAVLHSYIQHTPAAGSRLWRKAGESCRKRQLYSLQVISLNIPEVPAVNYSDPSMLIAPADGRYLATSAGSDRKKEAGTGTDSDSLQVAHKFAKCNSGCSTTCSACKFKQASRMW